VLVCLAINLAIGAAIALQRPEYLRDYRLAADPDGPDYVRLGRNLLLHGEYSRSRSEPFVPDALRTPGYPAVAGALEIVGGAAALYAANVLFQAGAVALLYCFVRQMAGGWAACWASLFMASDLALAIENFAPMSEPLFLILMLASLALLFPVLLGNLPAGTGRGRLWAGSFILGLTILTRPAALYLCGILAAACFVLGLRDRNRGFRKALAAAAVLLVVPLLPGALWAARNAAVLSLPKMTYVDANNLVYYWGAGAYQIRHGVSVDEARQMIAREFNLVSVVEVQNPQTSGKSQAEIDRQLRSAVWGVVSKYPGDLLLASVLGVAKASFSHATGELAQLVGRPWVAPGTGNLLFNPGEAWNRLRQNGPALSAAFFWQVAHVLVVTLGALLGMILMLRSRRLRPAAVILLVVLGYFYATTALFGLEAYWRCRVPEIPFLEALAGVAIARLSGGGTEQGAGRREQGAGGRI